jgi:hypothetical protein
MIQFLLNGSYSEEQMQLMEESKDAAAARMRKCRQKVKAEQGSMDSDRRPVMSEKSPKRYQRLLDIVEAD